MGGWVGGLERGERRGVSNELLDVYGWVGEWVGGLTYLGKPGKDLL